jgi:L-aspartate oxidase
VSTTPSIKTDVFIVGAGAAGLYASLHLPQPTEILVCDKGKKRSGSSPWAQGGVAAALGPDDSPDLHVQDTLRVAAGHADVSAVQVLCYEAPECIMELAELGCDFDRNPDGTLHLAREGGQSVSRSAHHEDSTGAAIMATLRQHATNRVKRIEGACLRLDVVDGRCVGGWVLTEEGVVRVQANSTVLATGGVGAIFNSTTNPAGATGDGIVLAWEAGAGLADLEFVQFHPTALAAGSGHQRVLVTEALRGAGAHVVDADGRRFLFDHHSDGEMAPRDVVARAIASRKGAWLDCRHLDPGIWRTEFPTVHSGCVRHGIDPVRDLIPVVPAAHYFVGGIQTDLDGRTTIPRLYAIGECSNTGVHGANRLAGNSLAEALVFGRRAARAIAGQRTGKPKEPMGDIDLEPVEIDTDVSWARLRELCTNAMGIERNPTDLRALPAALEDLARLPATDDRSILELRSAAILARLMARAALLRTESRGVHHRADHGEPVPEWAGVRLRLALTDLP